MTEARPGARKKKKWESRLICVHSKKGNLQGRQGGRKKTRRKVHFLERVIGWQGKKGLLLQGPGAREVWALEGTRGGEGARLVFYKGLFHWCTTMASARKKKGERVTCPAEIGGDGKGGARTERKNILNKKDKSWDQLILRNWGKRGGRAREIQTYGRLREHYLGKARKKKEMWEILKQNSTKGGGGRAHRVRSQKISRENSGEYSGKKKDKELGGKGRHQEEKRPGLGRTQTA